jgi:hypothetical protein
MREAENVERLVGSNSLSRRETPPGLSIPSDVGFAGSLRTLAPTRYFTAHPSTQSRWVRRSPSADRQAASQLVLPSRAPDEAIVPTIETLDVEPLSRHNTVHLPELCR